VGALLLDDSRLGQHSLVGFFVNVGAWHDVELGNTVGVHVIVVRIVEDTGLFS
jgi:hypothetical protein